MRPLAAFFSLAFLLACGERPATAPNPAPPAPAAAPAGVVEPSAAEPAPARPTVVFLGDSLTAGLGLAESFAYPAVVSAELAERGLAARVVNAGISGDTTAGGLARLDWLLTQKPAVVVVALGANDGLRGLPLAETEKNLRQILLKVRASGAKPLLCGMLIPPNYGPDYFAGFRDLYPRLAQELGVPLVPFLLDGVAADPALNQADGIHPTAEGQRRVAANVLPYLLPLLPAAAGK